MGEGELNIGLLEIAKFRVGGAAGIFFKVSNVKEILKCLKICEEGFPRSYFSPDSLYSFPFRLKRCVVSLRVYRPVEDVSKK
jgi:hypothetical protein